MPSELPKKQEAIASKDDSKPATKPKRKHYRSPQRRFAVGLIRISIASYVALLLILIGMETRLVYPGAYSSDTTGSVGLASIVPALRSTTGDLPGEVGADSFVTPRETGIETVEYQSTDDITLRGRLLERGKDRQTVLYFHGNAVKAAWLDGWLEQLSSLLDANVMAAEYRGFEDEISPAEKGVIADCLAARDYLCERYQLSPDELILFGTSLGGGCATAVASQGGAKALILDRTFDRMTDVAAEMYPFVPVRWIMRNRYDSLARLTVYHGPLIMIHGTSDELIPIKHGRRLYDSAHCGRKHFIEVQGMGHVTVLPDEVLRELKDTLERFLTTDP